jgi:hypothetical protein
MLALFTVFEHLSNVRHLLNRFYIFLTPSSSIKLNEEASADSTEDQRDILLGPILNNILLDKCLNYFDEEFREDLEKQEYFARELDACLLEMRDIERDLYKLKQRQCYFYERYLDFMEKKDQLIEEFIEYYDEYFLNQSLSSTTKQLRKQSTIYEFNIPVSNRFELLKRQYTEH